MEEFAKRMLKYIELCGMTQYEFAEKMGVAPSTVSNWVTGLKIPRMNKVDKMCKIFNCSRNDLLGEVVESDAEYSLEEKSIIEMYRRSSAKKKHMVYMLLTLEEKEE